MNVGYISELDYPFEHVFFKLFLLQTNYYIGTLPDLDPEDALSSMNPPELKKVVNLPSIKIIKPNSPPMKVPDIGTTKYYQEEKYDSITEKKKSVIDNDDTRFRTAANTPTTSPKKASWFGFFDSDHSNELNDDKGLKPIVVDSNICENYDIYSPGALTVYHTSTSGEYRSNRDLLNAGNQTNGCTEEVSQSKFALMNPHSNILHSSSTPGGAGRDNTTLAVSPLKSPMRLVSPNKGKWNIDASTQTEDSFELSGKERKQKLISKKCVCCTIW